MVAEGDMANVFSSLTHNNKKEPEPVNKRIEKLKKHVGHEISNEKELTDLIAQQRAKTKSFLGLLQTSEPWREAGDPSTPMLAANEGDPLQLHLIQGSQEEQHVFSMTGMKWLAEPKSRNSGYMNGQQIGISEHFEFEVSPQLTNTPTDYWYGSPAVENMWDGMWGLLRSFKTKATHQSGSSNKSTAGHPDWLAELPGHAGRLFGTSSTCPDGDVFAPKKEFFVTAWRVADLLEGIAGGNKFYNTRFNIGDPNAVVLVEVPKEVANSWKNGKEVERYLKEQYGTKKRPLEPLILRANAGDCVTIKFKNYLPTEMADGVQYPKSWSYNLMPPIVNGFNFNQFQMSSAIGLVPQLVTEYGAAKNNHNNFGKNLKGQAMQSFPHGCQLKNGDPFKDCDFTLAGQQGEKIGKNFASEAVYEWYLGDRKAFSLAEYKEAGTKETQGQNSLKECVAATKDDISCYVINKDRPPNGDDIYTAIVRYQPMEFGATAIRNFGDTIKGSSHGAVGALIVEPRGAECQLEGQATAELCGPIANIEKDQQIKSRASADVVIPNKESFRDFVLVMQDDLSLQQNGQAMPNHRMADDAEDTGQKGFNYRTESLWARNGMGTSGADFNDLNQLDYTDSLSSKKNISPCSGDSCEPETPIFKAKKGQKVRFRVVHPGGHSRQHALAIYGHNWEYQPWGFDSTMMQDDDSPGDEKDAKRHVSSRLGAIGGLGPSRHVNIMATAGGYFCVPGDYLYRVQENFQFNGGMWGIFRVDGTGAVPKNCHQP